MKLETLSEDQLALLQRNKEFYIEKFLNSDKISDDISKEVITFVYSLIDKPCPTIYRVNSPYAMQMKANELKGTDMVYYSTGTYLSIYYASFYAYYNTFVDLGIITEEQFPKYFKLREFVNSNIFMTIEFEEAIIICEKPMFVKKNDVGMHCLSGPAIQWEDGYCEYLINGRAMPDWIFEKHKDGTLNKMDFINEENEDVRAGIYEIVESKGEGSMLEFLGAIEVDKQTLTHANGETEEMILYKTTETFKEEEDLNGNTNVPLTWLKMSCPSTNTNYLIPSDASFDNCIDAAKYHRPSEVPVEIDYFWNQRS